ncbi:MAG: RsmE family RNA methyltransferase, partial [Candidatus Gastranaerophilales bacterium]|nr:RsmE family RNA methyltransferase [Candidatus Gastranaerophilales bacterium]
SRSVPKYNNKDIKSKIEKWQKIADESCKQCERADKPSIHYFEKFEELKKHAQNYDLVIACIERSNNKTLKDVLRGTSKHNKVLVIIGPEGGFEDKEIEFFKDNNFETVTISNLIYRAETAAISALSGVIYEYEL